MHTALNWENMRPSSARNHTTNVKSQTRASLRNEERPPLLHDARTARHLCHTQKSLMYVI